MSKDRLQIPAQELYQRAKRMIPGGSQLLSKRPEMYAPGSWPPYFARASGCRITDLEGCEYLDMTTTGIGSCLLGYANPFVNAAVIERIQQGSMCSLNGVEEVQLAEQLIAMHPWADQVRFSRTGGEAMAIAVRIARAATQRDVIAFCGYHGWSDWYLAANLPNPNPANSTLADSLADHLLPGLSPSGVPRGLGGTAYPFRYNNLKELKRIAESHGRSLAAVVMEPFRSQDPQPGFLEGVREICDHVGAALVFDEITCGWRFHLGGIHLKYGVEPDIVVFAKALGNGHPIAAVLGKQQVMESSQSTFISSTFWTEAVGPTAALATIQQMKKVDVPAHIKQIGELFSRGVRNLGAEHDVPVVVSGPAALTHLSFDHRESAALTTLLTKRMIQRGFLVSSSFYPSLAHESHHVEQFLSAADNVFYELAETIRLGDVSNRLDGHVKHNGFSRLT
ncbi:aminotransferase class III-fold pyridoxal phosphate-dependent enzyme [Bythopirellula goksoeyrii]|uniref:3-aminobutyryl-CoA aminotransferase n=1 Tax=Bythopirellula goksoeyrii TaxID=1400387 RepID=A0A5B9Q6R3_9BACT|nr:aminotransferase class III-fold pyridoxal phosphate-dependent enzyme [Bythopirellula goksoeyrii]QEG33409.1 3-aminobutyryl-CoA aminotransferase [Bythopirellula goksoeyrii]